MIRQRRKAQGLSLDEMSLATGVCTSSLSRIETGNRTELDVATLATISEALNLNPATLIAPFFTGPATKAAA